MDSKSCECPDQCNGKGRERQMEVGEALLGKFPLGAQLRISELGKASRCGYCGCVYVNGTKIGTWNSGVLGQGWHSGHYSSEP